MKKSYIPPLGARPRFVIEEERIKELQEAIKRFLTANYPLPREQVEEYNELTSKLETEEPNVNDL